MNRIIALFAVLLLSACVQVTDEHAETSPTDPKPVDTQPPAQKKESVHENPVDHVVTALSEPNHYEVRILISDKTTMVERISLSDQSRVVLPPSFEDGYFVDSSASSDQKYLYRIGHIEKAQYYLENEISVKIPKDLVIQSEVVLASDENWTDSSRLFLLSGGFITTNGFKLVIQTKKLFALGGVIRTFASPEGLIAGAKKDGGSIEVHTDDATGVFRIQLLGKNGIGGGTDAALNGTNGGPGGNTGFAILKIKNHSVLGLEPMLKPGAGGPGGPGKFSLSNGILGFPKIGEPGAGGPSGQAESFCVDNAGVNSCH